jgi:N-acetylneuraminic acid mutarotase
MKRAFLTLTLISFFILQSFSQNGWTQLTDYPGSGSVLVAGFNFSNTGLAGLGYYTTNTNTSNDIWEYFPATDTWVAKTSFTGNARYAQSGFSIQKLAFICLGSDATNYFNDLWEYDGNSSTWLQKANFPGVGRYGAIAQGSVTTAFVGLGEQDNSSGITDYFTDFYEYDMISDSWTQKASFPGQGRYSAFSFLLNNIIYVLCGRTEDASYNWIYLKDMYAYDIASDTWTQKTSYPGGGSMQLGGFILGQNFYIGTGNTGFTSYDDFWKYNPQTDTWTQLADFPGGIRRGTMSFSIGNTGYLGCGFAGSSTDFHDFWKYDDPDSTNFNNYFTGINSNNIEDNILLYPIPANNMVYIEGADIHFIEIYTSNGGLINHTDVGALQNRISVDISGLASGFYYAKINFGQNTITKKVIKN